MTSRSRRRLLTADRIPFSDESVNGDPMRYTLASNLADYMQGEVELSANRITSDTLSVDRIPNLPASKLPAPPAVTIDALGCSGTPSADTVLFGDCRWDDPPTTVVVALDMGDHDHHGEHVSDRGANGISKSRRSGQGVTIIAYVWATVPSQLGANSRCDQLNLDEYGAICLDNFFVRPNFDFRCVR